MNPIIRAHLDNLQSGNRELQGKGFVYLLEATNQPVDWAYEVWDEIVDTLSHPGNRQRASSRAARYAHLVSPTRGVPSDDRRRR